MKPSNLIGPQSAPQRVRAARLHRFQQFVVAASVVLLISCLLGTATLASGAERDPIPPGQNLLFGEQGAVIPAAEIPKLRDDALKGSADAARRLAIFYERVMLDHEEGLYWRTIAAENGSRPENLYELGLSLALDPDPRSKARARYWLQRAQREGSADLAGFAAAALNELDAQK